MRKHGKFMAVVVMLLTSVVLLAGCKGSSSTAASSATASTSASASATQAADDQPIGSTCPTSNTKAFAKTKFVLHAGLAFGAFHRYLYKPYKAGTFKKGAKGRLVAFGKGGLAALFIKREIRLASEDVQANPTLCKAIAAPLAKIGNTVQAAFNKAKNGDGSGLDSVNSAITSVTGLSKKDGVDIKEDDNPNITSIPS